MFICLWVVMALCLVLVDRVLVVFVDVALSGGGTTNQPKPKATRILCEEGRLLPLDFFAALFSRVARGHCLFDVRRLS